jgi:ABC-type branched-subunit amino acid transport system ATPase component
VQHIPPVLLELRNVDVVFDGIIQVLRSVNLEVRAGKVTALLGGNGAGKTTTLKAISGLLAVEHGKVTDGQIRFEGEDISNADPVNLFRRGVVQVLEGRKCWRIFPSSRTSWSGAIIAPTGRRCRTISSACTAIFRGCAA